MEKVNKGDIIQAISIYSSMVSSCIATLDDGANPNIVGLGKSEGRLLGGKGVLDIDTLSRAIRDSLSIAQEESSLVYPKAFVSISGGSIKSEKSRGMVKLGQRGEEISERGVREVLKVANALPIDIEREIIHSIPQDFIIDGQNNVKNPVGLYGVKLEVDALLITAHLPFLQNIIKSLNLSGIELEDIVFSGVAASHSLLSPQENEQKGIVLIEIDNNFTALSVFFDNVLIGVGIEEKSIITDGVLERLKAKVDKIRGNKPISKILLAGGGYVHEDFIEKVDSIFGIPSQMAYTRNVRGSAKEMNNPAHLTSIGLALYGLQNRRDSIGKGNNLGLLHKISRRVGEFINEYF